MRCRICGTEIIEHEDLQNIEIDVNNLYEKYINTPKANVRLFHCPECSHIQTDNMLSEEHYKNYNLMNLGKEQVADGGNSVRRSQYYHKVVENLYNLSGDKRKLLDIGCGHGTILKIASEIYEKCIGVEPSEVESEIARKQGLKVINTYFDKNFAECDFSAFVSIQVFEHLPAPLETIKAAADILKVGGVGYIEVPNGQAIYSENRYFDINIEHINYYTVESLSRLIGKSGLEIISIGEILNGFHIGAYVMKKRRKHTFMQEKAHDRDCLMKYIANYNNIAFWGAGIKGRTFVQVFNDIDTDRIKHIFDSNKTITGYHMGNCCIPIEYPDETKLQECDLIIVTALEYYSEIVEKLRNEFAYQGQIISIGEMQNSEK